MLIDLIHKFVFFLLLIKIFFMKIFLFSLKLSMPFDLDLSIFQKKEMMEMLAVTKIKIVILKNNCERMWCKNLFFLILLFVLYKKCSMLLILTKQKKNSFFLSSLFYFVFFRYVHVCVLLYFNRSICLCL